MKYKVKLNKFDLIKRELDLEPIEGEIITTAPLIGIMLFKGEHAVDKLKDMYCCVMDRERLRIRKLFDDEGENLAIGDTLNLNVAHNKDFQTHAIMMDLSVPQNLQTFSAFLNNPERADSDADECP